MIVTLAWREMLVCALAAQLRTLSNTSEGTKQRWGAPEGKGRYENELFGCYGENATAKHFNLYWGGFNRRDYKGKDVGGIIQVRATAHGNGRLMLHEDDLDDDPFVLALTHSMPNVTLAGWMFASQGKLREHWQDPTNSDRWAYFVPQSALRPLEELAVIINERAPILEAA